MMPPEEPGTAPPPAAPPPPPYPTDPATPVVAPRKRGRRPSTTLVIGLVAGILLGGAGGYLVFNGRSTPSGRPQASASASPAALATPTATPATFEPAQTPVTAPQGVVSCSVATPTGQHQLGTPGGPGSGQALTSTLAFCGGGDAVIPIGTTRFVTGANWGVGIADSCPVGSSGQSGMNTVLTVTEITSAGAQGPDTASEGGDWADGGSALMATAGSYQLRVTTVSPSCVWDIAIYPVNP